MQGIVSTDLYRYEIQALLKAFYPEEEVKVFLAGEEPGSETTFLFMDFLPDCIRCMLDGMEETVFCTEEEKQNGVRFDRVSAECKNAVKHLLYEMLCKKAGGRLPWGELIGIRPTKIARQQLDKGRSPEETAAFLENEHYVSREKAVLCTDIAQREAKLLTGLNQTGGYSLYVGIPFCPTTCLYCSFTSYSVNGCRTEVRDYLEALQKEIAAAAEMMNFRTPDTIYIGGGTPTALSTEELDILLQCLERYHAVSETLEFTVEAGRPDSITEEKLMVLKKHNVTRISVNPQTMKDETLELIGRRHSVKQTEEAFRLARKCGFDNINMDVILGLPEETAEDVKHTLQEIEKLGPDSLTVHSLALKKGSRMAEWIEKHGYSKINNTDSCMELAQESAGRQGMQPYYLYRQKNMSGNYENIGFAREGCYGLYNILIMEEVQDIVALGAGSVSKKIFPEGRIVRRDNAKDLKTYVEQIDGMILRKKKLFVNAK